MCKSRVSIILSVYNTPLELLERAVNSVMNQTYNNIELVIVDDCSTIIEVKDYLKSIESSEKCQILTHFKDTNKGKADSLNIGVRISTGEYYCILDHDDFLLPDYIERMIKCAIDNSADMVVSGMKTHDINGNYLSDYPINKELYKDKYFPWMSAVNLARMIRKSIVIDNGVTYPNGAWTEDIIFTAKIYPYIKSTAILPYEGYVAFINPKSSSRSISYYALELDQIPFNDIEEIIKKNNRNRYPYVSGLMNNEMMLIGYTLIAFSDKKTRKYVIQAFQRCSRELHCSFKELKQYDAILGETSLGMKILERVFNITNRMNIAPLGYSIVSMGIRRYYNGVFAK